MQSSTLVDPSWRTGGVWWLPLRGRKKSCLSGFTIYPKYVIIVRIVVALEITLIHAFTHTIFIALNLSLLKLRSLRLVLIPLCLIEFAPNAEKKSLLVWRTGVSLFTCASLSSAIQLFSESTPLIIKSVQYVQHSAVAKTALLCRALCGRCLGFLWKSYVVLYIRRTINGRIIANIYICAL